MNNSRKQLRTEPAKTHDFVCSWCEEASQSAEDLDASTLNYGICPSCLQARLDEASPASAEAW